jgi:hypothetical protein
VKVRQAGNWSGKTETEAADGNLQASQLQRRTSPKTPKTKSEQIAAPGKMTGRRAVTIPPQAALKCDNRQQAQASHS